MKRGDIYFADLDPVIGSEQGGRRPVLIIQNDLGNRFSPTVIALPLTSKMNKAPLRTHVPLIPPQGGVRRPSVILCEQVRTLEKSRLQSYLGRLTKEKMALVERALSALRAEDISKVALLVFRYNEAGNAFWEKQGFSLREDVNYRNRALAALVRIDT